jgi:Spy/CpxP family protein refolding chaperone
MIFRPSLLRSVLWLSASIVLAQGPEGGPPPDSQAMPKMRVDFLSSQLHLSSAQKAKAKSIFTDASTASESIRSTLMDKRQSLSSAVKKNDTAAIDTLAAACGNLSGQLIGIESKSEAAFYAILTFDQQAQYDSIPHGAPGGRGGPRGPAGFGDPPHPPAGPEMQ